MVNFIQRYRFAIFNLLFVLYIFLLENIVLIQFENTLFEGDINYILAIILILILIFEVYAIVIKSKAIGYQLFKQGEKKIKLPFIPWVFHFIVGILLVGALGAAISGAAPGNVNNFVIILFFVEVIRNVVILLIMMLNTEGKKKEPSIGKQLVADLFLLLFVCIAYTGTWGLMSSGLTESGAISNDTTGLTIISIIGASILFLVFYLPINMMYILERRTISKGSRNDLTTIISLVLVLIVALIPLFR